MESRVEEGSPIAVGMTVIGIGEGCEEEMMPLPDITELMDKALCRFKCGDRGRKQSC